MRIIPFTFGCKRDLDLFFLLRKTLGRHVDEKHYLFIEPELNYEEYNKLSDANTITLVREDGWGNGAGWEAAMMKVRAIRELSAFIGDYDYLMSVDSDTMFINGQIFGELGWAGIYGNQHDEPYPTKWGNWGHMSGCCIFIRGSVAKKIGQISPDELDKIRHNEFKPFNICENEDVVISYLAKYVGAEEERMNGKLLCDDIPGYFADRKVKGSMFHFNLGGITEFLGEPVSGKWDIPKVLNKLGKI